MHDATSETWRPIPDWEGLYEVSDLGRVRSWWCVGKHQGEPTVLKGGRDLDGYRRVILRRNGRSAGYSVHRLVMVTFIGPCPEGQETRHGPGGKLDNRLVNLCYGTPTENSQDKIRDGTHVHGRARYGAKLTWETVAEIRGRHSAGEARTDLAAEFGVTGKTIWLVVNHKTWRGSPAQRDGLTPSQAAHRAEVLALRERGLSQIEVGRILGIGQQAVSHLLRKTLATPSDTPSAQDCHTTASQMRHDSLVTAERDGAATERYESGETLTEWQLARRFRKSVHTARRWRRKKEGPPWYKDPGGTVWYRLASVIEWEKQQEAANAQPPARPGAAAS